MNSGGYFDVGSNLYLRQFKRVSGRVGALLLDRPLTGQPHFPRLFLVEECRPNGPPAWLRTVPGRHEGGPSFAVVSK